MPAPHTERHAPLLTPKTKERDTNSSSDTKPLYYAETSDGFIFASEVKALFASGQLSPQVAAPHINTYMAYGYVPGEECLFAGVKKLLPGHWLQVSPAGLRSAAYWDVEHAPNHRRSAAQTADELYVLLLDAVQIHMRSDVPVGIFLSGGLDSSATVSLLAEAGRHDLKTFAVAYDAGPEYDESRYARLVSERFQTDHHVLYIDPSQFLTFIPEYVWHMDEPVTEAAALSLYFIAKLLREHVTVALSGEGADELFAGYDIYRYMGWLETYRRLPQRLRSRGLDPLFSLFGDKVRKYVRLAQQPLEQRYLGVSLPNAWYAEQLYSPDFRASLNGYTPSSLLAPYYAKTQGCDALTRMLHTDLKTWLVDDLLIKADKMTMANSVELRVPFLDHRVVEYAATIPSDLKLRGGQVKWILKQAMQGRLPQEILSRKKVGFPTPLALMLQTDAAADYMRDLLLSPRSRQRAYFQPERIHTWIDQHIQKTADHHTILWQLIVLEEWHRQFIDHNPTPVVSGSQHTP